MGVSLSADGDDGHLSRLVDWITSTGGDVSKVRIDEADGIRGGVLDAPLSPLSDEVMVVPTALALSDDMEALLDTPIGAAIGRAGLALLQPDAQLALRLLHEVSLGTSSLWHDYIQLLPPHVRVARHLSDDVLLASRSTFLLQQSMLARKYSDGLYSTLSRLAAAQPDALSFDASELGWALDICHSRSLTVDVGGPRGVRRFLVPLVDMLNHNPRDADCTFTYDDTDDPPSFVVELKKAESGEAPRAPPTVGTQLWLDYGPQTSEELLLMYGFVPAAPTPYDCVALEGAYTPADAAAMPGGDAEREEKVALLTSCRYDPPRQFGLGADGNIDPALVCALRLIYLSAEECAAERGYSRALLHAPVSAENERRVAVALRTRIADVLDAEGAPLEADRLLLADDPEAWAALEDIEGAEALEGDGREQMRCAVQLRANRKALLADFVQRLDGFLARVDGGEGEGRDRPLNLLDEAFTDYMPSIRMT